jgi:DNA-binding MarR family transcriptional regulator
MITIPRALDADLLVGQGMLLSDYSALMHLSEAPEQTLRMSDLASACALSLSGMSRIVGRLEGQGLVQRQRASCDGRGLNAVLTDAGLARLRRAWPTHLASVRRRMMDHLGEADLPVVTAALQRFASGAGCADAEQGAPQPGDHVTQSG